jgi:predicted nucleic acid-binding protein
MAITHLLDTSVYSQPLRKHPLEAVQRRWIGLGDDRLCSSMICEAELLFGLELRSSKRLWKAYEAILHGRLPILEVDLDVARSYATLATRMRKRGMTRSPFDLLIAATAHARGLTLATCNYKDFAPIEGLAVEDWSSPP